MSVKASVAAESAVDRIRSRPWGLAVAVVAGDETSILLDQGDDKFDEDTYFQIGSVTKTMTGLLLADLVVRGEVSLDATVGSVLGAETGVCGPITLLELATQNSGLPRLPPNLRHEDIDEANPYSSYSEAKLIEALGRVDQLKPGYAYSNFGFMLLGLLISRISGSSYAELAKQRIFDPLGMKAVCGIPRDEERLPGYEGSSQMPCWTTQLPGAGGIA
ncbi:MAG: serine hydrolase domain-containing protein, partial [Actinomycetota bacterium]